MPLFHIQDDDRPAWVVAPNYADALSKWSTAVAKENQGEIGPPPNGIQFVCDDAELIVGDGFQEDLHA